MSNLTLCTKTFFSISEIITTDHNIATVTVTMITACFQKINIFSLNIYCILNTSNVN